MRVSYDQAEQIALGTRIYRLLRYIFTTTENQDDRCGAELLNFLNNREIKIDGASRDLDS